MNPGFLRPSTILIGLVLMGLFGPVQPQVQEFRRLPVEVYRQKMTAGWLGQMIGVSLGAPTEFRYLGHIMPGDAVPEYYPGIANKAFSQDDLYVEMTFLNTLDTYGLDVSAARAGIDFANSEYQLWHANLAARDNLRQGIAPPDSGHPQFSGFSDDIDYQIEADFAGLISPGMPNSAIALGNTFGRIMNYGDGLYGGQFMACMYAEAFFEGDPAELVEAGLDCIPAESQYAEAMRDVLGWWRTNPDDWETVWHLVDEKYQRNPDYRRYSSGDDFITDAAFNIDAKINGAYVVMGLLYGERDPLRTMVTAMRSGQDSDCNPASAGGILFTTLGYDQLPQQYISGLNRGATFSYTDYDFDRLIAVSEKLAREAVLRAGGSIEVDADGQEVFLIPIQSPQPAEFVQSWDPGPTSGSLYTEAQLAEIKQAHVGLNSILQTFAPGWAVIQCSDDPGLGLKAEIQGRTSVLLTYPVSREAPCILARTLTLPPDRASTLRLDIGHFPNGDWELIVRVNGHDVLREIVGSQSAPDGWLHREIDLSAYAGQQVRLELLNQANGWAWEGAYWDTLEVLMPGISQ
jgi:hypothetical protein